MARKKAPKATRNGQSVQNTEAELVPAAAALSFLKQTRGLVTWMARDLADALKIKPAQAERILSVLELQGYVKRSRAHQWMTTISGESISESKPPRLTLERAEEALSALRGRIEDVNRDSSAPYKITDAAAFGDFLTGRARVQTPEVGIRLVRRGHATNAQDSAQERKAQERFLKQLRGGSTTLQIRPYQQWMSARTHRNLLAK